MKIVTNFKGRENRKSVTLLKEGKQLSIQISRTNNITVSLSCDKGFNSKSETMNLDVKDGPAYRLLKQNIANRGCDEFVLANPEEGCHVDMFIGTDGIIPGVDIYMYDLQNDPQKSFTAKLRKGTVEYQIMRGFVKDMCNYTRVIGMPGKKALVRDFHPRTKEKSIANQID